MLNKPVGVWHFFRRFFNGENGKGHVRRRSNLVVFNRIVFSKLYLSMGIIGCIPLQKGLTKKEFPKRGALIEVHEKLFIP